MDYSGNQVCFQTNYFSAVVVIGLAIMAYALWQVHQQSLRINELVAEQSLANDVTEESDIDRKINEKLREKELQHERTLKIIAAAQGLEDTRRQEDIQRLTNPLIPPLQRDHYSQVWPTKRIVPVNTPTRGEYDDFQQVGYAHKSGNTDQMFPLFGRRIHSNKYEYYVIHPGTQIKIPIRVKNDWEINQDDTITIKGFPGDFKVELYDKDQPRYIPY